MANDWKSRWWTPPESFKANKGNRKISWLELFYDLVYVACIGQITSHIASHPTWSDAGRSFLLFGFVFWSWINGTQYYELHGNDSLRTRFYFFLQMLCIGSVAVALPEAFNGSTLHITIALAAMQMIITYLLYSVGKHDQQHKVLNIPFTIHYLLALLLLIISLFASGTTRSILLLAALCIDLGAPVISARFSIRELRKTGQVFAASPTLAERFGQMTIIVLTESVLATVSSVSSLSQKSYAAWIGFSAALTIAFLLWSIYFDLSDEPEIKPGYGNYQYFVFCHLLLFMSLSVFGACLKDLLSDPTAPPPPVLIRMASASLVAVLLMTMVIDGLLQNNPEVQRSRRSSVYWPIAFGVFILPLLSAWLSVLSFLLALVILLVLAVFARTMVSKT
jgi:low temperature requirement protein LtrA